MRSSLSIKLLASAASLCVIGGASVHAQDAVPAAPPVIPSPAAPDTQGFPTLSDDAKEVIADPGLATAAPQTNPLVPPIDTSIPADMSAPQANDGLSDEVAKDMAPEEIILQRVTEEIKRELDRLDNAQTPVPSLLFTPTEQASIRDAIGAYEMGGTKKAGKDEMIPEGTSVFSGARQLNLSGVVFKGEDNWIVWLNNQAVTPVKLPPEVRYIKVYKDYIELKWFDRQANRTVPIRLRTNQRFDLDSQTFLPG